MLSVNTFFTCFIYNPNSEYLTSKEQKIATIASRVLSFLSLTLLPRACKFFWGKKASSLLESPEAIKVLTERIQSIIKSSHPGVVISHEEEKAAQRIPCHQIIHGLFLGNSLAFLDTTCLSFEDADEWGRGGVIKQTLNPLNIERVITLCPLSGMLGDFSIPLGDSLQKDPSIIGASLKNHNIDWLNPGKSARDMAEGWLPLVHDCTFPNSAKASQESTGMTDDALITFQQTKIPVIKETDIKTWFEPVFQRLDEAVFYHKRTLIHCQAGVSRSASILAAYLINRFDVTHKEALSYLSSKRPCVRSKFVPQLREYEQALFAARAR